MNLIDHLATKYWKEIPTFFLKKTRFVTAVYVAILRYSQGRQIEEAASPLSPYDITDKSRGCSILHSFFTSIS